jgi:antitoxin ParD1/3/4
MASNHVALNDSLQAFVDQRVAEAGYSSAGEYLRDLIRRDRERQALRALVVDGLASGPGEPVDNAWFDGLRAGARIGAPFGAPGVRPRASEEP